MRLLIPVLTKGEVEWQLVGVQGEAEVRVVASVTLVADDRASRRRALSGRLAVDHPNFEGHDVVNEANEEVLDQVGSHHGRVGRGGRRGQGCGGAKKSGSGSGSGSGDELHVDGDGYLRLEVK